MLVFTVVDDSVLLMDDSVLTLDDLVLVVDDSELETDDFTSVLVSDPNRSTIVAIDSSKASCSQSSVSQSSIDADWALSAPLMTIIPRARTASASHASRTVGIRFMCAYLIESSVLVRVAIKRLEAVIRRR